MARSNGDPTASSRRVTSASRRDDLDELVDDLAEDDPDIPLRLTTTLERREHARNIDEQPRSSPDRSAKDSRGPVPTDETSG